LFKIKLVAVWLLAVFSFLAAGCGADVAAVVNGKTITSARLEEEVNRAKKMLEQRGVRFDAKEGQAMLDLLRHQVLEQMIEEELLLQEAVRLKVEPADKQVEEEIKKFRGQFESEAKYRQFLAANGFSEPKLKDYVKKNLAIQAVQEKAFQNLKEISETQAKEYYEQNKDAFTVPEQFQVRQILIPVVGEGQKAQVEAKVEAVNILNRLKKGEDFAVLAREKARGAASAADLYTFSRGETDPELEKAAAALKPGEISPEPVKTNYGYHIIKLEKIIPAQVKPFPEVKDEITAFLSQQAKQKAFTDYLADLKSKATIENKLMKKEENSGASGGK